MGRHYAQSKGQLHISERGNFSLERYSRENILDHVPLFRGAITPEFSFMDSNACPLRNAEVPSTLEKKNVNCMQWLAYSLYLNPIEMSVMLSSDVFHK